MYGTVFTFCFRPFSEGHADFMRICCLYAAWRIASDAPGCADGKQEIGFIDALFTSVSAVSVTGMSLINMKEDLTLFGQILMLFMIQVGGLGIMTIMAIMGISAGRRIRLQERLLIRDSFNLQTPSGMVLLVRKIIAMTFL